MYNGKLKIMHIAQAAGGVDRYLRTLLKYLDNEKFDNILVCSDDFDEDNYKDLVSDLKKVHMKREIGWWDMKSVMMVRKIIKECNPDIVYTHSSKAGIIGRVADIGVKNICIYNPHGWAFNMNCSIMKKTLYILIERMASFFCDKIVCISNSEYNSAIKNRICNVGKIKVIYNGIDLENKTCLCINKTDIGIAKSKKVIGFVGRLSEQKAPDIFVKMALEIKKIYNNVFFLMVGDGELKDEIVKQIDDYNLKSDFLITGWVDDPEKYMSIMDVGVLLSRWEGFGLVLPEYMKEGVPIVATRVDAIPDIIENEINGYLVEKNDYKMASKKVVNLMEDNNVKKRIIENGYMCIKNKFNSDRMAQEHEELFMTLKK